MWLTWLFTVASLTTRLATRVGSRREWRLVLAESVVEPVDEPAGTPSAHGPTGVEGRLAVGHPARWTGDGRDLAVLAAWALGGLLLSVRFFQWDPHRPRHARGAGAVNQDRSG